MQDQFKRTSLLVGEEGINKLKCARVAVFGIGGVGGYVCEALARSGVGRLVLVDSDIIDVTNSTIILEITGDQNKVSAIISMLDEFGIKEVIRTGVSAIARGDSELKNY